jgi:predicted TIM-barrel fold metal-dependent hydrolase
MKTTLTGSIVTSAAAGVLLLASASAQIGYKSAADAEQKKTLLLRDFHPKSMLHVKETPVLRAKFPVIDMHQHVNDARGIGEHVPPQELIERMNQLNIKTMVILTGEWGDKLQKVMDEMVKPYPGRFIVFSQPDWSKIDDPNFGALMVRQLDDAVRRGARGFKILKELGLSVKDKTGKLITVDDPRLDPVWEECGRLGIPVAIHIADPEAFFHPIDGGNERYEELNEHPDWSFYGPQFPSFTELLAARDRMMAKHPKTTFIVLHAGNWPENLDAVAAMMDRFPNTMIEFGGREAELGRQPRRTRKLFLDYQDRVMFGSDNTPDADMYQNDFRWLETDDEAFDYWGSPSQGRWTVSGLSLPDPVLEKIYHLNAENLFAQFKGVKLASQ